MTRAPMLALLLIATATAAMAEDGARGPERWLLDRSDGILPVAVALGGSPPAADPLTRFIEHCKRSPIGLAPLVTMVPPAAEDRRAAEQPTLAFVARAQGRTLVSVTRLQARADDGQDVVMQRTLVSDLFAGRRFSLTVYEDHAIADAAVRLMGVGTRLTFRPAGWPFRIELLTAYDLDAGASGYVAITTVLGAPALPTAAR